MQIPTIGCADDGAMRGWHRQAVSAVVPAFAQESNHRDGEEQADNGEEADKHYMPGHEGQVRVQGPEQLSQNVARALNKKILFRLPKTNS